MQKELLRIRVRDTEAATIEIVPSEGGGVEIVVLKKEESTKETTEKKFNAGKGYRCKTTDNLEILKAFCHEKNEELKWDKTMKAELLKFYKWYEERADEWKGTIQPEKLWARWQETRGAK